MVESLYTDFGGGGGEGDEISDLDLRTESTIFDLRTESSILTLEQSKFFMTLT